MQSGRKGDDQGVLAYLGALLEQVRSSDRFLQPSDL
jgi:hypothetical protein